MGVYFADTGGADGPLRCARPEADRLDTLRRRACRRVGVHPLAGTPCKHGPKDLFLFFDVFCLSRVRRTEGVFLVLGSSSSLGGSDGPHESAQCARNEKAEALLRTFGHFGGIDKIAHHSGSIEHRQVPETPARVVFSPTA